MYEAIKPKLGEKESQLLFEHIARQTEVSTKDLATKADVRGEVAALRGEMREELANVRGEVTALRGEMREELNAIRAEMARLEARLIKWNVGTIIAVAGLTLAIVKLVG